MDGSGTCTADVAASWMSLPSTQADPHALGRDAIVVNNKEEVPPWRGDVSTGWCDHMNLGSACAGNDTANISLRLVESVRHCARPHQHRLGDRRRLASADVERGAVCDARRRACNHRSWLEE